MPLGRLAGIRLGLSYSVFLAAAILIAVLLTFSGRPGNSDLVRVTALGAAFWALVKGSRNEIRKVVWPTRQETVQTTMIVVAFVLLVALILWGLDSFLGWLVSLAIG